MSTRKNRPLYLSYHCLAAKKVVAYYRLSVSRSGRSFFDRSHSERKMTEMILSPSCHFRLDVRASSGRESVSSKISLATGETLVTSNQSCRDIKGFYKFAVML